jgi:hypothetical protein
VKITPIKFATALSANALFGFIPEDSALLRAEETLLVLPFKQRLQQALENAVPFLPVLLGI